MATDLDQSTASVGEVLPFVWGRMYTNLLNAGFNSGQAMSLIRTYILASYCSQGIRIDLDVAEQLPDNPDN